MPDLNLLPISGLRRQMIFYIIFLAIVFLTMAVEMSVFLYGDRVLGLLLRSPGQAGEVIHLVQLKVGIMLLNLLFSIGLVMLLFTKRILIPLSHVIATVRAISDGDLSATVPVQTSDELGELSGRINELAANYQELIMLCRSMTGQVREALDREDPEEGRVQALTMLDELDETLDEFGRSLYGGEQ